MGVGVGEGVGVGLWNRVVGCTIMPDRRKYSLRLDPCLLYRSAHSIDETITYPYDEESWSDVVNMLSIDDWCCRRGRIYTAFNVADDVRIGIGLPLVDARYTGSRPVDDHQGVGPRPDNK